MVLPVDYLIESRQSLTGMFRSPFMGDSRSCQVDNSNHHRSQQNPTKQTLSITHFNDAQPVFVIFKSRNAPRNYIWQFAVFLEMLVVRYTVQCKCLFSPRQSGLLCWKSNVLGGFMRRPFLQLCCLCSQSAHLFPLGPIASAFYQPVCFVPFLFPFFSCTYVNTNVYIIAPMGSICRNIKIVKNL